MNFIYVFLVFFLISLVSILWPLFRGWQEHKKQLREDVRSEYSGAVIEDRAQELDETRALGEISENEFTSLKRDLEKTIVAEQSLTQNISSPAISFGGRSRHVLLAVALAMPLLVFLLYSQLGAKADWDIAQASQAIQSNPEATQEDRLELIRSVKARLQATPDNGHLLFMLGSLSSEAGDFEESVRAYRELKAMMPDSPIVLAELAQSLFLRAGNVITPEVRENTQLALQLDPKLPTALGFAGIDAFQNGRYEEAISFWQLAVQQLDPRSAASNFLTQGIARAKLALEKSGGSKATNQAKQSADELVVKVSLGEAVSDLQGNETVFVYARAWQGAKLPLAIQKLRVSDLPTTVKLTKDMAMAAGMDITSAPQLEVVARVSKTGSPSPASGDWTASYGPIILASADTNLDLEISEQIP